MPIDQRVGANRRDAGPFRPVVQPAQAGGIRAHPEIRLSHGMMRGPNRPHWCWIAIRHVRKWNEVLEGPTSPVVDVRRETGGAHPKSRADAEHDGRTAQRARPARASGHFERLRRAGGGQRSPRSGHGLARATWACGSITLLWPRRARRARPKLPRLGVKLDLTCKIVGGESAHTKSRGPAPLRLLRAREGGDMDMLTH